MDVAFHMIGRTVLLYIVILIIFRVMGKREIGELSILDLVVFIMIAEIAVVGIEDTKDPLFHTILPMTVLLIIQVSLAYIALKSERIRHFIDGKPTIIIHQGKIDEKAMAKQRYNFDDLLIQLREKQVRYVEDVEFAILEPSGKLSVYEKEKKKRGMPNPLILDGEIQREGLSNIQKDEKWLQKELTERGFMNIRKISYCSFHDGTFHIDIYEK